MEKTYKKDIWKERKKGNLIKICYKNKKLVMIFIKDSSMILSVINSTTNMSAVLHAVI